VKSVMDENPSVGCDAVLLGWYVSDVSKDRRSPWPALTCR
jgi:hypothetical protein